MTRPYEKPEKKRAVRPVERRNYVDVALSLFVLLFVVLTAAGAAKQAVQAVGQAPVLRPVLTARDYPSGVLAGWFGGDTPGAATEGVSMADYTGSNAGTTPANGVYAEAGTHDSVPYYSNGSFVLFRDSGSSWIVSDVLSGIPYYYYVSGDATPPTSVTFTVGPNGASPGIIFAEEAAGTHSVTVTLHKQSRNRVRVKVTATSTIPGDTLTAIRMYWPEGIWTDVITYDPAESTFPVEEYITHDYPRTPDTYTVYAQADFQIGITEVTLQSENLDVTTLACNFIPTTRLM